MSAGYQTVESDDPERGPQGLEFKTFTDDHVSGRQGAAASSRGYLSDQPQNKGGFWSLEYYQKYFDVDTNTVLKRCYATLLPHKSRHYISTHLSPSADLYGPFWTLTTIIFSLFVCSSLAASITSYLSTTDPSSPDDSSFYQYDFQLLSVAVSLVYAYGLGVPAALWAVLRYLGVDASEWSLVEALAVWGYGQFVWIPVSVLCIIPVPVVRWVLVGLAFGLSGYFLVANVYPILATAEAKATRLLVIVICILHAALALCFKLLFFSYYIVDPIGGEDPLGGGAGTSASETAGVTSTS